MKVTALLVSHDGGRWLPAVLDGLRGSTRTPDRVIAVDTGSTDASPQLIQDALGAQLIAPVLHLAQSASYAESVRAALHALPAAAESDLDEWIWLIHDDSNPAPECLAQLIAAVERAEDDVLAAGPKLREWPSLKRLLEVGVTLSGSGRRETGLEAGEYDQGQHDEAHRVLAVNTAGMLVRRDVLEHLGFDDVLPLMGNDLDFGWRMARAGHGVLVVPDAVMFHAEAAHRGVRAGELAARPRRDERAAAMHTLLVNGAGAAVLPRAVRLLFGGLLRAIGFLLVRAVDEAVDEFAALGRVFGHPGRILSGRRARSMTATVAPSVVRPLLAPPWMPLRHGLDFAGDVTAALLDASRDAFTAKAHADGHASFGARMARASGLWTAVALLVVALIAAQGLLTGPPLHGGALLAAPDSVGHWWTAWGRAWHWVGIGSDVSGPAYLLPLAVLGTVLFGQPGWVVWLLFLLAVPLTFIGAQRFLRLVVPGRWAPVWGAVAYALLPVVSGAVNQGRLGTVVGVLLVPFAARPLLDLAAPDTDRRNRATWRAALALALLVMFVPMVLLLLVPVLVASAWFYGRRVETWRLLALLIAPLLASAPWVAGVLTSPGALLVEAGRAASLAVQPDVLQILAGRSGGPGSAPAWFGLGIPLAALIALLREDTRGRVLRWWGLALVGAVVLLLSSRVEVSLPGVPESFRPWAGFLMLFVQAAWIGAVVTAADGLVGLVSKTSFGWRHPLAALALAGAVLAPALGAVWWVGHETDGPLRRSEVTVAPTYMGDLADAIHTGSTLVLTGGPSAAGGTPVGYRVLRSSSLRLGDDAILAMTPADSRLTSVVADTLSGRSVDAATRLASYGVAYVYAPGPVSPQVSGALDASNGFASASAPDQQARAWRVVPTPNLGSVHVTRPILHVLWSFISLLTILALIVLAMPSRRHGPSPRGRR